MSQASGNLQNLNPIILPDPVGLLPLAPGWKVLIVVTVLAGIYFGWRWWLGWRDQRYRRQALRAFNSLKEPSELPDLLKRTAISAYGRPDLAGLSGRPWHEFLDQSAGMSGFRNGAGETLDALSYGDTQPSGPALAALLTATRHWMKAHGALPPDPSC